MHDFHNTCSTNYRFQHVALQALCLKTAYVHSNARFDLFHKWSNSHSAMNVVDASSLSSGVQAPSVFRFGGAKVRLD